MGQTDKQSVQLGKERTLENNVMVKAYVRRDAGTFKGIVVIKGQPDFYWNKKKCFWVLYSDSLPTCGVKGRRALLLNNKQKPP